MLHFAADPEAAVAADGGVDTAVTSSRQPEVARQPAEPAAAAAAGAATNLVPRSILPDDGIPLAQAELIEERTVAPPPPSPDNNLVESLAEPSPGCFITTRNAYLLAAAFIALLIIIMVVLTLWLAGSDDSDDNPSPSTPIATTFALSVFYFATGGDTWNACFRGDNNPCEIQEFGPGTPWLTTDDPCEWGGVVCNQHGEVMDLWLISNGLTGSLPNEIASLSALEILYLYSNELVGPIPDSLGDLINLRELHLGDNGLTGTIPDTLSNLLRLRNLDSLERLNLNSNRLTGPIPRTLGNLDSLEELYLFNNSLTGPIPESLGKLDSHVISLENNRLTGPIPESLGNLEHLEELYLENNMLTGSIPAALCNDPTVRFIQADADICAASAFGCCREPYS